MFQKLCYGLETQGMSKLYTNPSFMWFTVNQGKRLINNYLWCQVVNVLRKKYTECQGNVKYGLLIRTGEIKESCMKTDDGEIPSS